jgi:putative acetyltransferase
MIRDARDDDSAQLIALIEAVYAEYPGCVLDVDGEAPHLRRPASAFAERGGRLWVAESAGAVVACGGFADRGEALELLGLYVAPSARRRGLAGRLAALVERAAVERGRARVELWTDTRFLDAHRLYERLGYVRGGTRELRDLSRSVEHHYRKSLP